MWDLDKVNVLVIINLSCFKSEQLKLFAVYLFFGAGQSLVCVIVWNRCSLIWLGFVKKIIAIKENLAFVILAVVPNWVQTVICMIRVQHENIEKVFTELSGEETLRDERADQSSGEDLKHLDQELTELNFWLLMIWSILRQVNHFYVCVWTFHETVNYHRFMFVLAFIELKNMSELFVSFQSCQSVCFTKMWRHSQHHSTHSSVY